MHSLFNCLCDMLESCDTDLYTLEDLRDKLKALAGHDNVYHEKTLHRKLLERYGDHIFFQLFVVAKMLFVSETSHHV
jgi:hypothetical protein